jgi:hypothetical protein
VFIYWHFGTERLVLCHAPFLWYRFSIPHTHPLHCPCLITIRCLFFSFVGG